MSTSPPTYPGVYAAKVYSANDPNNAGRIQMFVPQIFGASPVQIWAPPMVGGVATPAAGDVVWCVFQGGDPSYPAFLPGSTTPDPVNPQDLSTKHYVDTNIAASIAGGAMPTGAVTMYAIAAPPPGWLVCDGSAVSRTTYVDLFNVIGTTYGLGIGGTVSTFGLPDCRSRTPMGAGTGSGLTARAIAGTGGAETVALSTANLASHAHSHSHGPNTTGVQTANHDHSSGLSSGTSGSGFGAVVGLTNVNNGQWTTGIQLQNHAHTLTTDTDATAAGSGTAHANVGPFLVFQFIIKS